MRRVGEGTVVSVGIGRTEEASMGAGVHKLASCRRRVPDCLPVVLPALPLASGVNL